MNAWKLYCVNTTTILFEAGIDILYELKSYDSPVVSNVLTEVFDTLVIVLDKNYVDEKQFQNKNILSTCLDVFRINIYRNGMPITYCFFPFLLCAWKKFGAVQPILENAWYYWR